MNDTHTVPVTGPGPEAANAVSMGEQEVLARAIADRACVDDIRTMAVAAPGGYWDTRPMLDDREHSPAWIDMARQALAYADLRGLLQRHPADHHLVRIKHVPQPL